jgi:hypothetical protein
MTNQKKAIIILGVLAVIFILFIVTGVFMNKESRPMPGKETASTYENSPWSKRLAKPISLFTPALSTGDLHFKSISSGSAMFTIDPDEDKPFRSLKLSLENISGKSNGYLQCSFTYSNIASSIEDLRIQEDTLSNDKKTTIVVLKEGGGFMLKPLNGCRVMMDRQGKSVYICEKSNSGTLTINPMFR